MKTYLVTGGSGFFGSLLKDRLLVGGHRVINIDLHEDEAKRPNLVSVKGDVQCGPKRRMRPGTN